MEIMLKKINLACVNYDFLSLITITRTSNPIPAPMNPKPTSHDSLNGSTRVKTKMPIKKRAPIIAGRIIFFFVRLVFF